jgi:hypothetical protein
VTLHNTKPATSLQEAGVTNSLLRDKLLMRDSVLVENVSRMHPYFV